MAQRFAQRVRRAPWFTLALLTLTFSTGFVDRQRINLLVQPIKASFGLSDLQISLLQGAGFSITGGKGAWMAPLSRMPGGIAPTSAGGAHGA